MLVFFENISDQLEIFSYYSGIFYKTLKLLIFNYLIIHIWSFYKNILDIFSENMLICFYPKFSNITMSDVVGCKLSKINLLNKNRI